ncbi:MAG TPA: shikimate dehydrogenase [Gemmataceae bacterium]|jgi:3-dehydroquinate dehydratase/shikimate dehydrogenase
MTADAQRICVVIGRTRHKMVAAEIKEAGKRGAALIELRIDFVARAPDLKRLLADKPCPFVATIRRPQDGGRWAASEDARQMLLKQCIVSGGFDWVDLETDIADQIRRFKDVKRIVSYHNLTEFPQNLEEIYARMTGQDADIIKLVVAAQSSADNLRIIELMKKAARPTIAFCSGDLGFPTRILCLKYGAPFTYAAFNKERGVAPGMPAFEDLLRVYCPSRINAETKVYGVIGDPVAHSHSPLVHNAAFRERNVNAVYLPFRVPRGQLPGFLEAFAAVPVEGYSITIPHKEAAAQATHTRDQTVELTRAANTLIRRPHGFFGANTDYPAVLDTLTAHLTKPNGPPLDLHKRMVLILGAGGVARAVAHALHRAGAIVHITNRTLDRAEKLADEVNAEALDWTARHKEGCDLVVNCTPVGMHPNVDESPLHASYLRPGMVVFDTVYTPETTMLIREAKTRGAQVITGVELFIRQAGAQFHLFTGLEQPLDLMGKVLRRALSPVTIHDEE